MIFDSFPKVENLNLDLKCNKCGYVLGCVHEKLVSDMCSCKWKCEKRNTNQIDNYYFTESNDRGKIICRF